MIVIPNVSGVVGARCDQFNVISNSSRESSPSVKQYKLLMFSPDVPKNLIIIFVIYKTMSAYVCIPDSINTTMIRISDTR